MRHLLIVEDQLNLQEGIKTIFKDEYEVKTAADGFEALEIIANWQPDVVITDYAMPGMTGMEMIRKILEKRNVWAWHAMPLPKQIKIILCSARLTDEIRQEAKALGVAACLDKPFDLEEIKSLVEGE